MLISDGKITWKDALQNSQVRQAIIVIAVSDQIAELLADMLRGEATEPRVEKLVASRLVQTIDLVEGFDTLARLTKGIFSA